MNAKPIGGINLFVSLLIIAGHNLKKGFASVQMKKTVLSLFIIGAILIYVISTLLSGLNLNLSPKENIQCRMVYNQIGDRNIVLRIDDIQANYNKDIEIKMLDELKKRNLTASLGVIPVSLFEDKEISKYLTENRCDFEIALHGYDNSDYEFDFMVYLEG